MQLLVRNRVTDFDRWHKYLAADQAAAEEHGLKLVNLWRSAEDPNNVFFLLDVADVDRANAFMARPESVEIGKKSGVIDGSFHYLNLIV